MVKRKSSAREIWSSETRMGVGSVGADPIPWDYGTRKIRWERAVEKVGKKRKRKGEGGKGDLQVNRSVIASTLFVVKLIIKDRR